MAESNNLLAAAAEDYRNNDLIQTITEFLETITSNKLKEDFMVAIEISKMFATSESLIVSSFLTKAMKHAFKPPAKAPKKTKKGETNTVGDGNKTDDDYAKDDEKVGAQKGKTQKKKSTKKVPDTVTGKIITTTQFDQDSGDNEYDDQITRGYDDVVTTTRSVKAGKVEKSNVTLAKSNVTLANTDSDQRMCAQPVSVIPQEINYDQAEDPNDFSPKSIVSDDDEAI